MVDASDVDAVTVSLRAALTGGPALLTKQRGAVRKVAETEVAETAVASDVALVVETSGSTGQPKRVGLSVAALLASAAAAHERLGGPGQWLLALPLTYVAGLSVLVRSQVSGLDPIVLPSGHFDAEFFVEHVAQLTGKRRYTSLVPVQLARLVDFVEDTRSEKSGDAELAAAAQGIVGRLDAILIGGQALEPSLATRARALGWNVVATYGSSETAGGCVYDGEPLPGVQIRIGDAATREVWIAGPVLAEGYLGDAEQTAERFTLVDGTRWYHTGDAGEIVDGRLRVTGRLDRVLISGGLKISLDAVESAVRKVHGGDTAVAISIPNSEWGQCVALVVPGIPASAARDELDDDLYAAVVSSMGRAAAPRVIRHVAALPRLSSGKVNFLALAQIVTETER